MPRWALWTLAGCGGLTILTVAFVGCALVVGVSNMPEKEGRGEDAKDETEKKGRTKAPTGEVEVGIGEPAELSDRTLTVTSIERGYALPKGAPRSDPSNEFILANLTIRNTGDDSVSVNPLYFKAQDSNGVQRPLAPGTRIPDALSTGSIAAGGELNANVVLEVPQGDTGIGLVYEPVDLRGQSAIVNLTQ